MSTKRRLSLLAATTIAALIAGCGKTPDVADLTCADFDKITDPAQKAELLKKCPRLGGPVFKPSEERKY